MNYILFFCYGSLTNLNSVMHGVYLKISSNSIIWYLCHINSTSIPGTLFLLPFPSLLFTLPLFCSLSLSDHKSQLSAVLSRGGTPKEAVGESKRHMYCVSPSQPYASPLLPSPYWHTRICLCLSLSASAFLTFLSACHICPTQPDWMKQGQEHAWKEKRSKQRKEREREKWLQCFCQQWAAGVPHPKSLSTTDACICCRQSSFTTTPLPPRSRALSVQLFNCYLNQKTVSLATQPMLCIHLKILVNP